MAAKRRIDRELLAGSRAHYEDPAYYTQAYGERQQDVDYYVRHAIKHGGKVLELGCGNGRIALPLARAGVEVVGVDASAAMLRDLRKVLRQEPDEVQQRLTLQRGDMRKVRLGRRFDLVFCAFNTALHLYTRQDVEQFLACARAHLRPGGELVVDLSMPSAEELARDPGAPYRTQPFVHPTEGVVSYQEHFEYDPVRQVLFIAMVFTPLATGETFMTPLAHSQFFPREWEALLHYNGFTVRALYGDFEGGPLRADSDSMVWHAQRSSKRAR